MIIWKKIRRIAVQVISFIFSFIVIWMYIYFDTPKEKYKWLISLIVTIIAFLIMTISDFKRIKIESEVYYKFNNIVRANNAEITFFEYRGCNRFRFEDIKVFIYYQGRVYEVWTEKGKIYVNKQMIYDFSNCHPKTSMVDKMVEVTKEQVFVTQQIE